MAETAPPRVPRLARPSVRLPAPPMALERWCLWRGRRREVGGIGGNGNGGGNPLGTGNLRRRRWDDYGTGGGGTGGKRHRRRTQWTGRTARRWQPGGCVATGGGRQGNGPGRYRPRHTCRRHAGRIHARRAGRQPRRLPVTAAGTARGAAGLWAYGRAARGWPTGLGLGASRRHAGQRTLYPDAGYRRCQPQAETRGRWNQPGRSGRKRRHSWWHRSRHGRRQRGRRNTGNSPAQGRVVEEAAARIAVGCRHRRRSNQDPTTPGRHRDGTGTPQTTTLQGSAAPPLDRLRTGVHRARRRRTRRGRRQSARQRCRLGPQGPAAAGWRRPGGRPTPARRGDQRQRHSSAAAPTTPAPAAVCRSSSRAAPRLAAAGPAVALRQ